MEPDSAGRCPDPTSKTVRQIAARELQDLQARSIEVAEGTELAPDPAQPAFEQHFVRVRVESRDDLRRLGLLPQRLADDKLAKAIAADDAEALRRVVDRPDAAAGCGCGGQAGHATTLGHAYRTVRRASHPALAALLSDHYGSRVAWDSPLAGTVRKWATTLDHVREALIEVFVVEDIVIGRGASLIVPPASRSLLARNILIHRTGRLVHRGGYLKVWAHAIARFLSVADMLRAGTNLRAPWQLQS